MSDDTIRVRSGRIFAQLNEFDTYDLAQCSGLSDWNKPRGTVAPIREQSVTDIGGEDVVGYQRGSADMASFTIQGRLKEIQNWLFALDCEVNFQVLMKDCGDPGDYYGYKLGLAWIRCPPNTLTGEPLAIIEGDNVPIGLANPFNAIWGPYLVDYDIKFLSVRSIAETGTITDIVLFDRECLEDCLFRAGQGQYGYAVAEAQSGSPTDDANVWFTEDYGDTWSVSSGNPFAAAEDISAVVKVGTVNNHRVVVSRGITDGGNPAEIAYADVTIIGQTAWVNVDVGAENGQYITDMAWSNFRNMFAITNDGYIYRSRDGGVTWTLMYQHGSAVELREVSFIHRGTGWVVGDDDLVLFTEDYGATWTVVDGPTDGVYDLYTVHVTPDRKVLMGDNNGVVHGSLDEGQNWYHFAQQGVTATLVRRVRGYDTHWLWSIVDLADGSSRVLRSTDGGASWRLWNLAQNINPNNGLLALAVVDVNRVIVAGAPYPWAAAGGTAFLTRTETSIDKLL